jgi:hypothetical protein
MLLVLLFAAWLMLHGQICTSLASLMHVEAKVVARA